MENVTEETPKVAAPILQKRKPAKKKRPQAKAANSSVPAKVLADDVELELDEDEQERKRMRDSLHDLRTQPKVKITIASTETSKEDVKVGINGHVYQIPRDVECEVPEAVLHALENAKIISFRQQKRPDGEEGMEMVAFPVARFPVSARR